MIAMRLKALVVAMAVSAMMIRAASAEEYPTRPVTVVVPFAAGGPSDAITRLIADRLGNQFGQRFIIQNIGGGGGTIGTSRVVQANPDGYTLLSHHIGLATTPALYKSLSFDPLKQLAPIGLFAEAPMAIVARKDFPPNTLQEFISYLREKQDKIAYASAGIGGASFLCGLFLAERIHVKFTNVPYVGTGPAYTDLLAGRTDVMCDLTTGNNDYVEGGQLKGYALAAAERLSTMPKIPTTAEAGLANFTVSVWYGLYAPAKTPAPVIERLSKALQVVMQDKLVAERLAATGTTLVRPEQATPAALHERLKEQIGLWTPIIQQSGVSAD
jgi:tripartite-type tricarboxylate transporter receptor subunit TctC